MLKNLIRKSVLILCLLLLLPGLAFSDIHSADSAKKPNATSIKGRNLGPRDGYVAGEAIDTATGQPLAGAIVRNFKAAGSVVTSPVETTTDQHGRYGFPVPEGLAAVEVTKEGYISAYREFRVQAGTVVKPLDAWLSPVATATPFNPIVGTNLALADNSVELEIPPSTFSGEFGVSLTRLVFQALPMPLPAGWAPLAAVHLGPEKQAPKNPFTIMFRGVSATAPIAIYWDRERHAWFRIALEQTDEADEYLVRMSILSAVALVRPDAQPEKPTIPKVGETLIGLGVPVLPDDTQAEILSNPDSLFMQPGSRSGLRVRLTAAKPLSSGTRVQVEVAENYQLADGKVLSSDPVIRDLLLFQAKTGLEGRMVVSPLEHFEPALLEKGAFHVDVHAANTARVWALIGPAGGRVTTLEGGAIMIPPGAVEAPLPMAMGMIREPARLLPEDSRFSVLGGICVDLGGAVLAESARMRLELEEALPEDAQVLALRSVRIRNLTRYALVGRGAVNGKTLTFGDEKEGLPFKGIRREGRYIFVHMTEPVGFLSGAVWSDGQRAGRAVVEIDQLPFISLVDPAHPSYLIATPMGAVAIHGEDLLNGRRATVIKGFKRLGETATLDLKLTDFRPTVLSTIPKAGADTVPITTPISVRFSSPIDQATVSPETFTLTAQKKAIAGSLSLLPDRKTVVFRTQKPLEAETVYTLILTSDIRDTFGNPFQGNRSDDTFVARFLTQDTEPPPPPEAGQIKVGTPVDDVAEVTGTQGTVEPGVVVTVRNKETDVLNTVIASDDGSFSVSIRAGLTDDLELLLHDDADNETVIQIGRVTPPPGMAVMGDQGGVIEGKKGIGATVPPGFLPPDTILDLQPIEIKKMAHPFSKDLPGFIAGGVSFGMKGIQIPDVAELRFSVDGFPRYTVTELLPLFRIERELTLPETVEPDSTLTLRLLGEDVTHRTTELTAELPIVADSPDRTPRTITREGPSTLRLTLPTQAAPGETITISAAADPPNIKLRVPANPLLTGTEQFAVFAVRDVDGKPFWDLVDRAALKTLENGKQVLETTSPPYSGIRRDTSDLVVAAFFSSSLAFVQVLNNSVGAITPLKSAAHDWRSAGIAVGANMQAFEGLVGLGHSIQGLMRWPDRNVNEFSVVPVKAGLPTTIEVLDPNTNERIAEQAVPPLPPDSLSSVLILGEDDRPLLVTAATSQANHAVPVDAGMSISFSHLVKTSTITNQTLFIEDIGTKDQKKKIDAEFKYRETEDKTSFIVTVKPLKNLRPQTRHRLVATTEGIKRPNGKGLEARFELPFTTAPVFEIIGHHKIPNARAFDVVGDTALVTQRHIRINRDDPGGSQIVNRLMMVSLEDPEKPKTVHELPFEGSFDRDGPLWAVRGMEDVDFKDRNNLPVKGDLALITLGNSGTFSTLRVFDITDPTQPKNLCNNMVSIPLDVLQDTAKLLVIPKTGFGGIAKEDVAQVPLDSETGIGTARDDWKEWATRSLIGKPSLEWEVRDYFTANLKGIPKTTAYPWVIDHNRDHTVYFVNQGIGIMTIDLAQAIPPLPPKKRGRKFGPSYIPRDKVGVLVVRDDESLKETSEDFAVSAPTHLSKAGETVDIRGEITNREISMVIVNGFRAEIKYDEQNRPIAFEVLKLPLREGVNPIHASAFARNRQKLGAVKLMVLRDFEFNPMAGPGSVALDLPPLSVAQGETVTATASLVSGLGRLDEIYINGQTAKYCGKGSEGACRGSVEVELEPGINSVVATAIDLDMEIPDGPNYADMRVTEGLALAVKNDLWLFDASGLVPIGEKIEIGKAYSVSVAQSVMVDVDNDGKTALEENDDEDDVTIFDELRNLALVGEGNAKRLTFVDITEPHRAEVLSRMLSPTPVYRAAVLPKDNLALVAAGDYVLVVDLTRAKQEDKEKLLDEDKDGVDDRILYKIKLEKGGAWDVRVDLKAGMAYILQRNVGLTILRLDKACSQDIGVDVTRQPVKRTVRFATLQDEKKYLLQGIRDGLGHSACAPFRVDPEKNPKTNAALLSQGSSACIWPEDGRCSSAYQPGLSDYDFEFIVPVDLMDVVGKCVVAMEEAIHKAHESLKNADVSVFPVRESVVTTGYRHVEPATKEGGCGGGSDKYGDLCLGRNGNILKWVLEGEWVGAGAGDKRIEFNNGIKLDEMLDTLGSPITKKSMRYDPGQKKEVPILDPDADEADEPTHVPRLEGLEWAFLEDFALNQSGARIRIKGAGIGKVPVNSPFFIKKIHKAAKAGIRAVFGKMLAYDDGNQLLLGANRDHYRSMEGCLTRTDDPEKADDLKKFDFKPCESFTEFIASSALQMAKINHEVLTEKDALLAYQMFRLKADVGPQIRDEEKANDFIIKVMDFIESVKADEQVKKIYAETLKNFSDKDPRRKNMANCKDTYLPEYKPTATGDGAKKLKLKVPVRFYNGSYVGMDGVELAFYHDDKEIKKLRVTADLVPGESIFFPREIEVPDKNKKDKEKDAGKEKNADQEEEEEPPPEGSDAERDKDGDEDEDKKKDKKKKKRKEAFDIKPGLKGLHQVRFMADPESQFTEYDKANNFDGFFYYLIYPKGSSSPLGEMDRPKPPVKLPDPPASKVCLIEDEAPPSPNLELISLVEEQYEVGVEVKDEVKLGWIVQNRGNVDLHNLKIQDYLVDKELGIKELPAGESKTLTERFTVPDEAGSLIDLSTVEARGPKENGVGPVSAVVKINVVEPLKGAPVVKIYSPPKQDPIYSTMDESMPVWGLVESDSPLSKVTINGQTVTPKKEDKGLYRFETPPGQNVTMKEKGETKIVVVAVDDARRKGSDKVFVRRAPSPYEPPEELPGDLRVIKRVRTSDLENYHERARAKPGDTLNYQVRILNKGLVELTEVSIGDLDLVQALSNGTGEGLVMPPSPPFKLGPGEEKKIEFEFEIPKNAGGGVIANRVFVGAQTAGGKPFAASDGAIVLVDGRGPFDGDPDGGIVLNPGIVLLRNPKDAPKELVTQQLKVLRVKDGADVTRAATTRYETLEQIMGMAGKTGITDTAVKKINETLKSYKLDKVGSVEIKMPSVGKKVEVDKSGKLVGKDMGLDIVRAVHTLPDGKEIYSNYVLVVVGIANVQSIDVQPRSFLSLGPQATQYLTNLIYEKLWAKYKEGQKAKTGKDLTGKEEEEQKKLVEFNIPMFLAVSGPFPDPKRWTYLKGWGPYLSNWIGKTGFAELVSIKFEFMGGAIRGVDILEAARELLKLIPPVMVGPVPVPVGWLLAQLVGPTASQFLDFEATGVADVRTGFPKGFVSATGSGLGRVTGTLDLTKRGFGKAKDDFLVVVGPELLSTEVRPKAPKLRRENLPIEIHTAVPESRKDVLIPLLAKSEGEVTLTLKARGVQDKTVRVIVTGDPKGKPKTPVPKGTIVLKPKEARTLTVPLLASAASGELPVEVVNSDPSVVVVSKVNSALVLQESEKTGVFAFAKIGFAEKKPAADKKKKKDDKKKDETFGIPLPTTADLVDFAVGKRLDNYLLKKLLPVVPVLTEKDVESLRMEVFKKVLPACPTTMEFDLTLLEDKPEDGLGNISLKMKLAFAPGKDDKGNPTCKLVVKSLALGLPTPNFAQWYRHNKTYLENPYQDTPLKDGDVHVATLKTLGDQAGSVVNWLDKWYLRAFIGTSIDALKMLLELTLTRDLEAKAPGIVHLGVDTVIPFLGESAADTYNPFWGEGGLTIKVVNREEKKPPVCFPKKRIRKTKLNAPVTITLLGHSYRRDKAGKPLPLAFEATQGPNTGKLEGLPQKAKRKVKVTFTPQKDFPSTETFTFKVNDGRKSSEQQCAVEIEVSDAPPEPDCYSMDTETCMNTPVFFLLDGFSPQGLPLTFEQLEHEGPYHGEVVGLPQKSGIGLAAVAYFPEEDYSGLDFFHFRVDDGAQTSTGCVGFIDVQETPCKNTPPKAVYKRHPRTPHDTPVSSFFEGLDDDKHRLSIDVTGPPQSGKILQLGPVEQKGKRAIRRFIYDPNEDFEGGRDSVTFEVRDHPDPPATQENDRSLVEFEVNIPPEYPECKAIAVKGTIPKGTSRTIPINPRDKDDPKEDLKVRIENGPAKGTITGISVDEIVYLAFEETEAGPDSFTYVVEDPYDESGPCKVTVIIEDDNEAPVARSKHVVVQKNSSSNPIVLQAEDDPEDKLVFGFPKQSARGGAITGVQQSGPHTMIVDYAPAGGYTGPDGFTFIADDGSLPSKPGAVSIKVNAPPVAVPDTVATNENSPITIDVLKNDFDEDGKIQGVVEVAPSVGGTTAIVTPDVTRGTQVRFTPLPTRVGVFEFDYTIMDNDRAFAKAKVNVTVIPVNEAPDARDDRSETNEGVAVTVDVLANDTDPDGDDLSVDAVTAAQNGQVFNEGGSVRYEPNPDFSGNDSFSYTVDDNNGARDTAEVQITVKPVNDPPSVPDVSKFQLCCKTQPIQVLKEATDPDGKVDLSSLKIVKPPKKGKAEVSGTPGVVNYKPKPRFSGQDSFTVTVEDEEGKTSKPATVRVTVGHIGGYINEIVRGESKVEIFNPEGKTLDITGWMIGGYGIGSDPTRESYHGQPVNDKPPSAENFHPGAFLVVHLTGVNLSTRKIELRDNKGKELESLDPDQTCYFGSRKLRPSLSRIEDGFNSGNPCYDFHWVAKSSLGEKNR